MLVRRLVSTLLVVCLALAVVPPGTDAATFVVDGVGDATDGAPGDGVCAAVGGGCSLRAALEEANASPNGTEPDAVAFAIGGAGPHVIAPSSALPAIVDPVVVDGYTQPGSSPSTAVVGTNATLRVVIDGSAAGPGDGIDVLADDVVLRGLVVHGFARLGPGDGGHAIRVQGDRAVVEGCFLGTDAAGAVALGNEESGVLVDGDDAVVGGHAPASRNLVSGNGVVGIDVRGARATVLGNLIGLDATGDVRLQNGRGVRIDGPQATIGAVGGLPNVISGNGSFGVQVLADGDDAVVVANLIGTDASGTADRGNGSDGILVQNAAGAVIGDVGAGNLVSGNNRHGIQIDGAVGARVVANLIGTDLAGSGDVGNGAIGLRIDTVGAWIEGNVVAFSAQDGIALPNAAAMAVRLTANRTFSNTGLGIDLESNGVTENDDEDLDADPGANGRQNFPVPTSASSDGATTDVSGTLISVPSQTYRVEVFANTVCDPSDHGESERYLGAFDVTTDAAGLASFADSVAAPVIGGTYVTATATDAAGNTSELSACVVASGPATTTTTSTTTSSTEPGGSTTTTTSGGSTTTSTAPIPCTDVVECVDGDACTVDACTDGFCAWTTLELIPGVVCHVANVRGLLAESVCDGCRCRFERRLRKIERKYERAEHAARIRGCKRGVGGGRRQARRLERKVNKLVRKGCLPAGGPTSALVLESGDLATAAETLVPNDACMP